ncbi:synaptonemal complex central element protein 1-like isoform X8 [Camelus dromedarius]|uniref:synaptonemal complex central element protein 1-like isoform X8 n=1 Tax=Camelus dromedarius TaxID=9838 RepID=UPI0031193618
MAGRLEPLEVEPPEVASEAEGQTKSSKKTEDLLEMVKKLQKEGSLEPQIEDLINRINELQQEALRTLQLHCQRTERESQRLHVEEQLEDLIGQHKDLWEFHVSPYHCYQPKPLLSWLQCLCQPTQGPPTAQAQCCKMLKQRLAWEISALQGSLEQLLTEERLARARLQEVEQRLRSPPEVEGAAPAENGRRKEELEELGGQVPAQTQSTPEGGAGKGEVGSPGVEARPAGTAGGCPRNPPERRVFGCRTSPGVETGKGRRGPAWEDAGAQQPDSRPPQAGPQLPGARGKDDLAPPVELALTPP